MSDPLIRRFQRTFAALAAAARAANAVQAGRKPSRRDLRALDIDPDAFNDVQL